MKAIASCCLLAITAAALVAVPGAQAAPATDEYEVRFPNDPNAGESRGGNGAQSSSAGSGTETSGNTGSGGIDGENATGGTASPDADGSKSGDGNGSRGGDDRNGAAGNGRPGAGEDDPSVATPVTSGEDDGEFPALAVALAAGAVLAIPLAIWWLRRGRNGLGKPN